MRLLPTPELLIAAGAAVLIVCGATWWLLAEEPSAPRDVPSWKGEAVRFERATLPTIGDFFRDYNVNTKDPFVPSRQRDVTDTYIKNGGPSRRPALHPPVDVVRPPPPRPVISWPAPTIRPPGAPVCIGEIALEAGTFVLVRMPGAPDVVRLAVGEHVPESVDANRKWTLVAVTDDGLADFKDPAGKDRMFPIGGPAPEPPAAAPAPKPVNGATPGWAPNQIPTQLPAPPTDNPATKPPRRRRPPQLLPKLPGQ